MNVRLERNTVCLVKICTLGIKNAITKQAPGSYNSYDRWNGIEAEYLEYQTIGKIFILKKCNTEKEGS